MAGPRKQTPLEASMAIANGGPYVLNILGCSDGTQAKTDAALRSQGVPTPDTGELCLAFLEHMADTDIDPIEKAKRPDKALLAPYQVLLADKEYPATEVAAKNLLATTVAVGNLQKVRDKVYDVRPVLDKQGNQRYAHNKDGSPKIDKSGQPIPLQWVETPGSAFNATFIDTVMKVRSGAMPAPLSGVSNELLKSQINDCFQDATYQITNDIKMGNCTDVAKFTAGNYLKKTLGMSK